MIFTPDDIKVIRSMLIYWDEVRQRDGDQTRTLESELYNVVGHIGADGILQAVGRCTRHHEILEKIMALQTVEDTPVSRAQIGATLREVL